MKKLVEWAEGKSVVNGYTGEKIPVLARIVLWLDIQYYRMATTGEDCPL